MNITKILGQGIELLGQSVNQGVQFIRDNHVDITNGILERAQSIRENYMNIGLGQRMIYGMEVFNGGFKAVCNRACFLESAITTASVVTGISFGLLAIDALRDCRLGKALTYSVVGTAFIGLGVVNFVTALAPIVEEAQKTYVRNWEQCNNGVIEVFQQSCNFRGCEDPIKIDDISNINSSETITCQKSWFLFSGYQYAKFNNLNQMLRAPITPEFKETC